MAERCEAVAWNPGAKAFEAIALDLPPAGDHDLTVAVAAASVNPVDLKLRAFAQPTDAPRVLGFDACGTVTAVGAAVTGFAPGDRVWYAGAAIRPGSNARLQRVDARIAARAPATLDDAGAAAMPLTLLTAWEALFERLGYAPPGAGPQAGRLLVINGAGGVGSVALQLARLAGIAATATASRAESADWCRRMGAAGVVGHGDLAGLPEASFDRIFCCHDTDAYFDTMARLIAPQGVICSIVGARQPYDLRPLFQKSAGFVWEYMFTRSTFGTADLARQGAILAEAAALVDAGRLTGTLTATDRGLTPETLAAAHAAVATGRQVGKRAILY